VVTDLNGDRVDDSAILVVEKRTKKVALFVLLSNASGRSAGRLINVNDDPASIHMLGISAAPSGTYVTACGRGYWDCAADEPASVRLERTGIRCFKREGPQSLVFWNQQTLDLQRVWLTD
jgi:hypothetical protein